MSSNTTYNELHENAKNLELEESRQVPLTSAYLVTPVVSNTSSIYKLYHVYRIKSKHMILKLY